MTTCLLPLGVNGFMPSFGRQTMSFLVLTEKTALLLDAGTGISRLLEQRIASLLQPYDCLNIILSHYHLDHVVGISYLPGIWMRGNLRIYAPGKPFVNAVPEKVLNILLRPPLFSITLQEFPTQIEIVPITQENLQLGDLPIQLRGQKHPGGSVGFRIADVLAYITDTVVDQATQMFVKDVEFLLHEVWLTEAEARIDEVERSRHSYTSGVAKIATQAKVGHLMPVHHHPKRSTSDIRKLVQEIRKMTTIEVVIPEEGKNYQLD